MMNISGINGYVYITLSSFEKNASFSQGILAIDFNEYVKGDTVIFRNDIKPVMEKLPNDNLEVLRFSEKSVYLILKKNG